MWKALQIFRPLTSNRSFSSVAPPQQQRVVEVLRLNTLQDNPGAVRRRQRVGRGVGSGRGKTSKRGHKGQKARGSVHPTFEGGQTKFYKLLPKRGFKRHEPELWPLNLSTVQTNIDMGRLDASQPITLRDLQLAGVFKANAVKSGVKLLADGEIKQPLDLVVSRASTSAIEAVEAAGGTVTCAHYNRLALRALFRPQRFDVLPKQARPPPKWQPYYTSWKNRGYLNPQVQLRAWLSKQSPEVKKKWDEVQKA